MLFEQKAETTKIWISVTFIVFGFSINFVFLVKIKIEAFNKQYTQTCKTKIQISTDKHTHGFHKIATKNGIFTQKTLTIHLFSIYLE